MVILDTNIIIDHLRQYARKGAYSLLVKLSQENPKETLALSILSIQELYEGRSTRSDTKEAILLATISPLKILPYTYEIAQLAGIIARDREKPMELADAGIAATASYHHAKLCTLNPRDFEGVGGVELYVG